MSKHLLCVIFVLFSAVRAFSWTDGELLVWISIEKGWRGLTELGKKFEKDLGIRVKLRPRMGSPTSSSLPLRAGKGLTSSSGRTTDSENGPTPAF